MASGKYKIPFDKDGNQMHFPELYGSWVDGKWVKEFPDWVDNFVFTDELQFDTYSRGRSAAYFHFKSLSGKTYCMFLTDLTDLLLKKTIKKGKVWGEWTFIKRGMNYGIRLAKKTACSD